MRSDYKETPSPQPEVVRKTTTTTTRKTTKQITAKTPKIKVQVGNTMKLKRNFFKIFLFQIIYSTNLLLLILFHFILIKYFAFLSILSPMYCFLFEISFFFRKILLLSLSVFDIYHLLYCVLSSSPLFALP